MKDPHDGYRIVTVFTVIIGVVLAAVAVTLVATQDFDCKLTTSQEAPACLASAPANNITGGTLEPPLPGVMPGKDRPKLILAQDIDWPPYAFAGPGPSFDTEGIGADVARGMGALCDMDITVVQTGWANCWTSGKIGEGLLNGYYHGCMTYTHTIGSRPRFLEMSNSFLKNNKPAGIMTRLVDGVPVVSPQSDLSGVKIADVTGWAPTEDGLQSSTNKCTGASFQGYEVVGSTLEQPNDSALQMLLTGMVDAVWIYADQGYNYKSKCEESTDQEFDCALWSRFGTDFVYVQTGLFGHMINGTTLTISKKGSGLADIVNPCLQQYMQTEDYFNVCTKHGLESSCFANEYFSSTSTTSMIWETPTNELTTTCADGYCPCDGETA